MNSIGQRVSSFTRWVGAQVVGKDDFRTKDDVRQRDLAVIGAATGAVAGATIGVVTGFQSQHNNTIKEVWVDHSITHPEMNGYSHHTSPDYSYPCVERDKDNNCTRTSTELDGWYHSYSPNITERVVGHYTAPTFQNTNHWEPLMGGAVGAISGGLVGLGIGLGIAAIERSMKKEDSSRELPKLSPETQKALLSRTGTATIAGAAVGIGVGAYLGSQAGTAELASKQTHTRVWNVPVMKNETLGHVPSGHYERNWFGSTWASPSSGSSNANVAVNREVPVYDRAGDPRLTGTQKVFTTNRYGPLWGGVAGGAIGAGVGLAAGLVIGVADKLLTEHQALKATA